jgi:hypothetical protein
MSIFHIAFHDRIIHVNQTVIQIQISHLHNIIVLPEVV